MKSISNNKINGYDSAHAEAFDEYWENEGFCTIPFHQRKRKPVDSRWYDEASLDRKSIFANRGHLESSGIMTLLIVNLVWNGFVTLALIAPFFGDGNITGMGPFLYWLLVIPFVFFGAILFVGLLAAILEPFRSTRYEFTEHAITKTTRYFDIPFFTRCWKIDRRTEMQLAFVPPTQAQFNINTKHANGDWYFAILFRQKNKDILRWNMLTQSEAEWIATKIHQNQPGYFVAPKTESAESIHN